MISVISLPVAGAMVTPSMWWPVASTPLASPGTAADDGEAVPGHRPPAAPRFEDFVTHGFLQVVPGRVDQLPDPSR